MRIVTIRARDDSFLDPVLEGHGELRAHVRVAFFAQRRLRLPKQRVNRLRAMNRMATGTGHTIQGVLGGSNIGA